MTNQRIAVDTAILKSDVGKIDTQISKLKGQSKDLRSSLNTLATYYEGQAWDTFRTRMNQDLNNMDNLIQAIEKFTRKTDSARQEYERCESTVKGIVNSIRV